MSCLKCSPWCKPPEIKTRPLIVLYDSKFWKRLFNFELLVEEGAISPEDLTLFQYADTPEEAWQIFKDFYQLKD